MTYKDVRGDLLLEGEFNKAMILQWESSQTMPKHFSLEDHQRGNLKLAFIAETRGTSRKIAGNLRQSSEMTEMTKTTTETTEVIIETIETVKIEISKGEIKDTRGETQLHSPQTARWSQFHRVFGAWTLEQPTI